MASLGAALLHVAMFRLAQVYQCYHRIYISFPYSDILMYLKKTVPASISLSLSLKMILGASVIFGNTVTKLLGISCSFSSGKILIGSTS